LKIKNIQVLLLTLLFSVNITYVFAETAKKSTNVNPVKPKQTQVKPLKVGDIVSGKFVSSFEPAPFVGLRYTFLSSSAGGEYALPPREETSEVVSMNKDYATLLLSGTFHDYREKVVKISDIRSSGVLQVQFRYDGLTSVNVPFAKFKNATKVSVSNKTSDLNIWLVKGIGVVKMIEYDKNAKVKITTELKDFRGKNNTFPDKLPNRSY
jgi:hypothetical protein